MLKEEYIHDEEWKRHIYFDFPKLDNGDTMRLDRFIFAYKQGNQAVLNWSKTNGIKVTKTQNISGDDDVL